jgi:hypothetical protein
MHLQGCGHAAFAPRSAETKVELNAANPSNRDCFHKQ